MERLGRLIRLPKTPAAYDTLKRPARSLEIPAINFCFGAVILILAASCSTSPYQAYGGPGSAGYRENEIQPNIWTITYTGDDFVTDDTLKVYWFYRAAELTLAHGYHGFSVEPGYPTTVAKTIEPGVQVAMRGPILILVPVVSPSPRARLEFGKIELLHRPFRATAGRHTFDAEAVRSRLDPIVHGPKCERNNVCPYDHALLEGR